MSISIPTVTATAFPTQRLAIPQQPHPPLVLTPISTSRHPGWSNQKFLDDCLAIVKKTGLRGLYNAYFASSKNIELASNGVGNVSYQAHGYGRSGRLKASFTFLFNPAQKAEVQKALEEGRFKSNPTGTAIYALG